MKKIRSRIAVLAFMALLCAGFAGLAHYASAQQMGACSKADPTGNTIMPKETCDTLGGIWIAGTINPNTAPTATPPAPASYGTYKFLAPLSPDLETFDSAQKNSLSVYLNIMIKVLIGIAAVLAMIMIVAGGIQYMTSGLVSSKEAGKHRITNAIIGLLIALGAYIILFTINPNLLKTIDPSDEDQFATTTLTDYGGDLEGTGTYTPISQGVSPASLAALRAMGIICPGEGGVNALPQIAQSFSNHVTYNNNLRGTIDASVPTVYLDCSAFVAQVYACAGLSNPGSTTTSDFSSKTAVPKKADGTLDVNALHVGDLVGWTASDYGTPMGHVLMYIGNGQFINAVGGSTNGVLHAPNASVRVTTTVLSKIKWINPAP